MMRAMVVGATGAVGRELLALLCRDDMPAMRILPVATADSAGRELGQELGLDADIEPVTTLEDTDVANVDIAFFAAGAELSRKVCEKVAAHGPLVIDNTSAYRMFADVPLTVPQVNPGSLASRPVRNIVANPNCSTIQLVRALHPLRRFGGLRRVSLATYQAGSGGGLRGLAELAADSRAVLDGTTELRSGRFGPPLAFDLIPQIGTLDDDGYAHEERKLRSEPRKIMGLPDLRIEATAVRAPVFHCHCEAVTVRLGSTVTAAEVTDALAAAPGIRSFAPGTPAPTPRQVERSGPDRALVHIGRIRVDPDDRHVVSMWTVADNLWVGAADNAVGIALTARRYGWLG